MRNVLLLLVFFGFILAEAETPQHFRIVNPDPDILRYVERHGGSVSRYMPGEEAELFLTAALKEMLQKQGMILLPVEEPDLRLTRTPAIDTVYHGYEAVTVILDSLERAYPELCRRYSIGETVENRDIWALKITDNPDVEEAEPEVRFIAAMHGNEVVTQELMLYLIDYLLQNYPAESRIRNLLDSTEIWIIPNMNYDGTAHNQRFNAHSEDLNRSFPDREFDAVSDTAGREPEVQAVMNWSTAHSFVLAANFHAGVIVVNYPWDKNISGSGYAATPDDDVFRRIALAYATHNSDMFNSSVFEQGITNGATWYEISGSMQDWNYHWNGCMEVTIELSKENMPDPALLPAFWDANRESMIRYLEQVHSGVKGIVTDTENGAPLPASVRVNWRDTPVFSDPDVGDYYRLLEPGTYDLVFESDGYRPLLVEDVQVSAEKPTRLDVKLAPSWPGTISGMVITEDGEPAGGIVVYCQGKTDTVGFDNRFRIEDVEPGLIHIFAHATNFKTTTLDTLLANGDSLEITLILRRGNNEYVYDFETESGTFTANKGWEWGEATSGPDYAYSGSRVWGTVLDGNYPGDHSFCYLRTPLYSLLDIDYPLLEYYQWFEIEEFYDGGNIKISADEGKSWRIAEPQGGYPVPSLSAEFGNPLGNQPGFTGRSDGWNKVELDLTEFISTPFIMIRFDMGSDKDKEFSGWYIDNFRIIDGNATRIITGTATEDAAEITIYPNPANPGSLIRMFVKGSTTARIAIFNSLGQCICRQLPGAETEGKAVWVWNGKNDDNTTVSSGIYFVKFSFGPRSEYRKLLIIK